LSQKEDLLNLFRRNGNKLSLCQILNTTLAAEYRARMSEARRDGMTITFKRGKTPSDNEYRLYEPEKNGQLTLA